MTGFFEELQRRKVYRVAVAYIVAAGFLIQIASAAFPAWELPNWSLRLVIVVLLIGFPIALILAWTYDLTAQGIQATPRTTGAHRRRNLILLTAAGVIVSAGGGFFLLPRITAHKLDKSIAVLPFQNLSSDPDNAYFADGVQDEILTRLAKIDELKVIARSSTERYKSSGKDMREIGKQLARHLPKYFEQRAARAEEYARGFVTGGTMFEELGFYYVGPIDGHNLDHLLPVLANARDAEQGPILVHVVTQKGKGYAPAEASADKYHGVVKFDVATGAQAKAKTNAPAYTKVFAQSLIKEARKDDRIVAVTAAMPSGTGLDLFGAEFPHRTFDVGIAEQHGVTFAAGLATEGFKPFATIYSTFLQRAYDQVVHDVAIQRLPVRFAMDRAGLVGADGPTHAGAFDIAYLGCLPGFVVMAAADEADLVHMVATAAAIDDRPSALRYPRGEGMGVPMPAEGIPLEIGKGRVLREGTKVALFSFGARLAECFKAADELATLGLSTTVADARFAKPLDTELLLRLAREHEVLITIEEGAIGGFAAHVLQALAANGVLDGGLKVRSMMLPDLFIDQDSPAAMYAQAGLDAKGIVTTAFEALGQNLRGEAVKMGRG